ncbi:unnamed protein product [Phytophthora fragariaefolia]|uniref:Unnamed protein product n=1 Tax=Phytophthora fragariaefolia TaxID=1490495 RepID=A0A9W6Y2E3_9STRA|nr:unnamed protein product [Phytophthora fragariaefolia]
MFKYSTGSLMDGGAHGQGIPLRADRHQVRSSSTTQIPIVTLTKTLIMCCMDYAKDSCVKMASAAAAAIEKSTTDRLASCVAAG